MKSLVKEEVRSEVRSVVKPLRSDVDALNLRMQKLEISKENA